MQGYSDFKMDENGNWDFNNIVSNQDAIKQMVKSRVSTLRYTNDYDYNFGIDFANVGIEQEQLTFLVGNITDIVLSTAGVLSCEVLTDQITLTNNVLRVPFQFETLEDVKPVQETFEISV